MPKLKFDFETLVDRTHAGNMKEIITPEAVRQAGSITYSGAEMDFKTAPVILEAFIKKAENGLFGYTLGDDEYLQAVQNWMSTQREWMIDKEWIIPTYGTIHSLATAIRAFTEPGDGIILQTPGYMRYKNPIDFNQRKAVINPLVLKQDTYEIDFAHLEECMADKNNKIMVVCNPHNPIAKVWPEKDLEKIASLAQKYQVLVFSDEIFAEVVFPGYYTLPFSSVAAAGNNCIVATSLGKTFNFTGFSHANMIIPNPEIRETFRHQRDVDHYGSIDPFVYSAVLNAYYHGGEWVEEMNRYVYENACLIREFFDQKFPQVKVCKPEGTFVIWINWKNLNLNEEELNDFLVNEAFLHLDPGHDYGENSFAFTRMNIAAPRAEIKKSLNLLLEAAEKRGFTNLPLAVI